MFMEASKSSRENFDYFLKWVESSIFIRVIGGCMAVDQLKNFGFNSDFISVEISITQKCHVSLSSPNYFHFLVYP